LSITDKSFKPKAAKDLAVLDISTVLKGLSKYLLLNLSSLAFLDFLGVNGQNQSLTIITFN
jgi:hypothetical protein